MSITAAMVKELRDRTGAGMMECKKALTEAGGDIEKAIEDMRKSGAAKAAKKAGRVAAEGVVVVKAEGEQAAIVEINSETDFAAKSEDFIGFTQKVVDAVLAHKPADIDALKVIEIEGGSVETVRDALVAKIGENIQVRRFEILEGAVLGQYKHGERIGVLAVLEGGDETLGKDVAMHIAATNPEAIDEAGVSQEIIDKEKDIFTTQARESGKPDDIIEKMIIGRMKKFMAEVTLVGQAFVKNPDVTVGQLLKEANASCKKFIRFEVGEGIEKEEVDFAAEVAAQAAATL